MMSDALGCSIIYAKNGSDDYLTNSRIIRDERDGDGRCSHGSREEIEELFSPQGPYVGLRQYFLVGPCTRVRNSVSMRYKRSFHE